MLFALLRFAINNIPLKVETFKGTGNDDWAKCYAFACDQGVMAIAWDAVMALPSELQPERALKLKWALAVENYTGLYRRYCNTIAEISDFYAKNGIATVQLKGVGLSTYYPVPERRQGGDIDIYTYSTDTSVLDDKQANELADQLMRDKGIEVDMHSYKHSFFYYKGIPIENHKFFSNVEHYATAEEAEVLLHENFNPCRAVLPGGHEIMVPSPQFNSIFIILHALQHFTSGLALHHLCDWACVLKKTGPALPLSISDPHFTNAVRAMNQICIEYLGTEMPQEKGYEELCDIIMQEVLHPKYHKGQMPHNPLGIFWYKTKRFAYSAKLRGRVWNTTVAKAVWQSVVGHLKEPKTILERGE